MKSKIAMHCNCPHYRTICWKFWKFFLVFFKMSQFYFNKQTTFLKHLSISVPRFHKIYAKMWPIFYYMVLTHSVLTMKFPFLMFLDCFGHKKSKHWSKLEIVLRDLKFLIQKVRTFTKNVPLILSRFLTLFLGSLLTYIALNIYYYYIH